jgi:hypothetical protein
MLLESENLASAPTPASRCPPAARSLPENQARTAPHRPGLLHLAARAHPRTPNATQRICNHFWLSQGMLVERNVTFSVATSPSRIDPVPSDPLGGSSLLLTAQTAPAGSSPDRPLVRSRRRIVGVVVGGLGSTRRLGSHNILGGRVIVGGVPAGHIHGGSFVADSSPASAASSSAV